MFDRPSSSLFEEDEMVGKLRQLVSLTRDVVGCDVSRLSGAELKTLTVLWSEMRSVVDVGQGDGLAELDRRGTTDAEDGFGTAAWLATATQAPRGVCKRRVEVGVGLVRDFPVIRQAIVDGRVGWEHGAQVCKVANPRIVDKLGSVQQILVDETERFNTFEMWARYVATVAKIADSDGPDPQAKIFEINYLKFIDQYNGTVRLEAELSNEYAEIIKQAIGRESEALFNKFSADQTVDASLKMPSQATRQALALVDIVRRSNGSPDAPFRPIADITMVVQANGDELKTDQVDKITADMLACDPVFRPIVIDSLGTPLAAGRSVRLATNAQRRALAVRDGGCVFPGCTANDMHCEAHHVIHYRNGGKTDLNNLALLCHHHHSVTHRNSWHMQAVDDVGNFKWTTPTGREINSQRHGRRTSTPPTQEDQNSA
jgi:hypothetical protein